MSEFGFLQNLGVDIMTGSDVLGNRKKKIKHALAKPGKGNGSLRQSIKRTITLLLEKQAIKTNDPDRISRIWTSIQNT